MEFRAWIFEVILICALSLLFAAANEEGPEDQDYRIYSAAIENLLLNGNPGSINISDHTEYPDFLDRLLYSNPPFSKGVIRLEKGTLESFLNNNRRSYPLVRRFNLSSNYTLVNERNDSHATWIASLSRVGYSTDRDQCMLLLDNAAYWYISEGTLVLLEKENGSWKVKATQTAYIGE